MSQFELTFWNDAGKFYTITEATNQKMVSRTMEWAENRPRKLTVALENKSLIPAENLLSTSFAGWDSGTGAIGIGTNVNYFVYPDSAPTTKTEVFWGFITEVSQASNGILTIIAKDYLEKFEYLQPQTIIANSYRDLTQKGTTEGVGARTINDITETGLVWPAVFVGVATTDVRTTLSGTTPSPASLMDFVDPDYEWFACAQAFVARGDGLIGLHWHYSSAAITTGGQLHCAVQADVGGLPSGINIVSRAIDIATGSLTNEPVQFSFVPTDETVQLAKGEKYWIVWTCDNTIRGTSLGIIHHRDLGAGSSYDDNYWRKGIDPVTSWTESVADRNFHLLLDFADYIEVAPEDHYFDAATSKIVVNSNGVPITTVDSYYSFKRGKVSYYYGTVSTQTIFERLIGFDPDMTANASADCDTTYSLYQTRGKSIGECLRELADTFETAGGYSGFQHIVAAYKSGATNYVKVGFGAYGGTKNVSHGADSTTDDELRINSANLKRTTSLRPASVVVIGKATDGSPIIVQRDDRALATSFRTKSKMALTTTYTDESLNTFADADRKAWQILDSVARDTWEGTIVVAGVFPDLFNLNSATPTYGAGGRIYLKYSPLGITGEYLHVKGIVLHENATEIQISNEDLLLLNALTDARGRAERSESFAAPDDPFTTIFTSGYTSAVEAAATMYMQLCTAANTIIPDGVRVLCTKTANARYNTSSYHAEFEADNGHTIHGTNVVILMELWDAATGGSKHATVTLYPSEYFAKWRTTRVIAEMHCKAA